MARMMVTMNDTSTTVDNSVLISMFTPKMLDATGALELAPAHLDVQHFLGGGKQLGHVHRRNEEEAVEDRERHQSQVLLLHRDRMQRGREVQPGEQHPPVQH